MIIKFEMDLRKLDQFDLTLEALQRAIDGKPLAIDFQILMGVKSIMEGIKEQCPREYLEREY